MGLLNTREMVAVEVAYTKFGPSSPQYAEAKLKLEQSRDLCVHDLPKSKTVNEKGKHVRPGDTLTWCTLCHRALAVNGNPIQYKDLP